MFDWIIRNYEKGVRRLFKQRGGIIANEDQAPPIPGIIQVASADVIAQIFDGDVARLEAESRGQRFGGGAISFNRPRK
jgi:hypothetical protein